METSLVQVFLQLVYLSVNVITTRSNLPIKLSLNEEYFVSRGSVYTDDIEDAAKFLKKFNRKADDLMNKNGLKNWAYETDLTDKHLQDKVESDLEIAEFFLSSKQNATFIKSLDLPPQLQRQISLIRRTADSESKEMRREVRETIAKMTGIFGKAKIKKDNSSKRYSLSDLDEIMKSSRNRKELNWAWKGWRDKVGPPMKSLYSNLVDLLNIGAREHGWIDYGDYSRSDYEMGDDFELSLDKVWQKIEPLYKELHAYVRYRLKTVYNFNKAGSIPANLLGDMFAQNWENIFPLVKPSKKSKTFDVTNVLRKKSYTVDKMFHLAEQFFVSIGLDKMPNSFWKKSVLTKPPNKEMVCHASAWDISNKDVRIKMCTKVNQAHLTTIHHEMGHIEYFLAYKKQPNTFRAGANPGFHEAIGDTISLSVETPSYLSQVGLRESAVLGEDDTISFLLSQALRRVAPIPYNLLVDKWRWRVYEGNITENTYNREWWKLRVKYQGVEPPVSRPANAFDAASKYHIGANVQYVAYFVSYVLQFQLHKAFCKEANFTGPLHLCSIYKSTEAGAKLRVMLEAGRSKPWPRILKETTGERDLKPDALLEYFQPLREWLESFRKKKNYPIGWNNGLTKPVLQRKTKKYEAGQERSGILKTNNGGVSLSISIPSTTLNELLKKGNMSSQNFESSQTNTALMNTTTPTLMDLARLLDSAKAFQMPSPSDDNKTQNIPSSNDDTANTISNNNTKTFQKLDGTNEKVNAGNMPQSGKEVSQNHRAMPNFQILSLESLMENGFGTANTTTNRNASKQSAQVPEESLSNKQAAMLKPLLHESNKMSSKERQDHVTQPKEETYPAQPQSAAAERPESSFPSVSVSQTEPKENPKTAGVSKQSSNPLSAAIPQVQKTNPVPENQIALLPVSLPNSVLSALKNIWNGTNFLDLAALQNLGKNETLAGNHQIKSNDLQRAASDLSNTTKNGIQTADTSVPNSNALHNSSRIVNEDSISHDPQADAQLVDAQELLKNSSVLSPSQSLARNNENSEFTTTQQVIPCRRSDGNCLFGKVVTEGNSLPAGDESKGTVSISPALLIQKILEHHVAEKSTPDPVRNVVTSDNATTTSEKDHSSVKEEKSIDMDQLMKLLIKNRTANASSLTELKAEINPNGDATVSNRNNDTSPMDCSDLRKRGISLMFNCRETDNAIGQIQHLEQQQQQKKKHKKGGTLSISPTELIQKLLESKNFKNEVNRKTIPSANVVKTSNGFQLNFDLNPKDQIPSESNLNRNRGPFVEHLQHVNVYNTPKGMVVKPKSSVQLLKPLFVPVQNKDKIELGGTDSQSRQ